MSQLRASPPSWLPSNEEAETKEPMMDINTTVTLRNGSQMPLFGLGTWLSSNNGEAATAVTSALEAGYLLIDSAQMYGNEGDVGAAIKSWCQQNPTLPQPFVVTKLKGDAHEIGGVIKALQRSLQLLQMDSVDLFLIHSPSGMRCVETWKEMLECKTRGLAKVVGVSNFGIKQLEGLQQTGLELPEVNQIELHPWLQQHDLRTFMNSNGIQAMGYCPLARCKQFEQTEVATIANTRGVEVCPEALVAIRWSLEQGIVTIPKSSNPTRIIQNASVFQLDPLTETEHSILTSCEIGFKASNSVNSQDLPWEEVK